MVAWLAESPGAQSPLEERVAGNPGRRATSGTKRLKLVAGDQKHSTDGAHDAEALHAELNIISSLA